jgi:hypothetical protein
LTRPVISDSFAGDRQRFAQRVDVADVVGQQKDQARVEQFRLLVGQVAMRIDQDFVEIVARRISG